MSNHQNKGNSGNNGNQGKETPKVEQDVQQNTNAEELNFQASSVPMITIQDANGKPVTITLETFKSLQANIFEHTKNYPTPSSVATGNPNVNPDLQYKAEDFLEEPVVFFAMRTAFTDYGAKDHKTGTYHLPPLAREGAMPNEKGEYPRQPIEFKFSHVGEVLEGRNINKIKYCTYHCQNKKVLQYLLNHPLLGIEFFKVTDKITTTDGIRGRALSDAHQEVLSMGNDMVLERLTAMNATISQDMQENRNNLVSVLADQRLTAQDRVIVESANLVGGKGNIINLDPQTQTAADIERNNKLSKVAQHEEMFANR